MSPKEYNEFRAKYGLPLDGIIFDLPEEKQREFQIELHRMSANTGPFQILVKTGDKIIRETVEY